MCVFDGGRGGNYFMGETESRSEVEARVRRLRNENGPCKDDVTK